MPVYTMKQGNICVDLSTEPSALPAKYQRLVEASQAGLSTPRSLLLDSPTCSVDEFLAGFPAATQFIVRSANKIEDGSGHSLAGYFWSSAAVSLGAVPVTLQTAWSENQRLLADLQLNQLPILMLQEYIQHVWGGVLFQPWSFFSEYAYVEYSNGGVQQVVAGQADSALISLASTAASPLALAEAAQFLEPYLRELAEQLRAVFRFPLDCEWAYASQEQRIVVLQIRAQTHAIGALFPLPSDWARPAATWQFTALSESLGKISPLSFSLLVQLYQEAQADLQSLGCKAEQVNFLAYQPDGSVLVDPAKEQLFYAPRLFGGFWRGWRAAAFRTQAEAVLAQFDPTAAFHYPQLSSLFSAWLIQTILQAGAGRELPPPVHAYELSWPNSVDSLSSPETAPITLKLRNAFLQELNKLKQALLVNPAWVFCDWAEYTQQAVSKAISRQVQAAPLALYDYAVINSGVEFQSLAARTCVRGTVCCVQTTSRLELMVLPEACILVSPYFANRWIPLIPKLAGIIVLQANRLSHAAIVAREYQLPYVVLSLAQFAELKSGSLIELDTRQGKLHLIRT